MCLGVGLDFARFDWVWCECGRCGFLGIYVFRLFFVVCCICACVPCMFIFVFFTCLLYCFILLCVPHLWLRMVLLLPLYWYQVSLTLSMSIYFLISTFGFLNASPLVVGRLSPVSAVGLAGCPRATSSSGRATTGSRLPSRSSQDGEAGGVGVCVWFGVGYVCV